MLRDSLSHAVLTAAQAAGKLKVQIQLSSEPSMQSRDSLGWSEWENQYWEHRLEVLFAYLTEEVVI